MINSFKERLLGQLLYIIPKNTLSYWVGHWVHKRWPHPFGSWLVKWFACKYRINMQEAEKTISEYPSIGELFTRKLKPGLRSIEGAVVHPADSLLTQRGLIKKGLLMQIKDWPYRFDELLSLSSDEEKKKWEGGRYFTYYLCPTDYHRVHSPVSGQIVSSTYIPGTLWPVNTWSVQTIPQLFSRNERMITFIQNDRGGVAVVMVGATNVGKMTVSYDPQYLTNQKGGVREILKRSYHPTKEIQVGEELGVFHMGSTVIVLYSEGYLQGEELKKDLVVEDVYPLKVLMGQSALHANG